MDLNSGYPLWLVQSGLPYIGYFPGIQHALFALGFGGNGIFQPDSSPHHSGFN